MRRTTLSTAVTLAIALATTFGGAWTAYAQTGAPPSASSPPVPLSILPGDALPVPEPGSAAAQATNGHSFASSLQATGATHAKALIHSATKRIVRTHRSPNGPYPAPDDPSLVIYGYDPDYTFAVRMKTDQETHLVFAPDEEIVGVYLSNTGKRWLYHTSVTRRDLFIEARLGGLTSAATIITTRRRYELELRSTDTGRFDHRVSWDYSNNDADRSTRQSPFGTEYASNAPRGNRATGSDTAGPLINLAQANFDYRIEGNASFAPTLVFDNGRFTFLQLPHNARLPAVMVMDAHGDGEITDLITLGNDLYEVPQITEYGLLLRRDRDEIRIYNQNASRCGAKGCAHDAPRASDRNSWNSNLYGKS